MKKWLGLSAAILLLSGCGAAQSKEEGIKSIKKSQYLYQWSGTKKNEDLLVATAVDNFYKHYADAFNKVNYGLMQRSVKKNSPAELSLKKDIKSNKFTNMYVYSYTTDKIERTPIGYKAKVGREISNLSTPGRIYSEEIFHFKYDPALKQMMVTQFSPVEDTTIKVKDQEGAQKQKKGNGVAIDVLSTDFQNLFLADDSRYYGGVVDGMSMQVMNERYGNFTDFKMIKGKKYYIYGGAAVRFNEEITEQSEGTETVTDMVIWPPGLPYQDILAFYGYPNREHLKGKDKYVDYDGEGNAVMRVHLTDDQENVKYIEKV